MDSSVDASVFRSLQSLFSKILFTVFILCCCRIGVHIVLPNVDFVAISSSVMNMPEKSGLLSVLDVFTGGSLSRAALFSLGIIPYVISSIIVQIFFSYLKGVDKSYADIGRAKILFYTRVLSLIICSVQAVSIVNSFEGILPSGALMNASIHYVMLDIITLIGGFIAVTLLGEAITESGVGNGVSLIILSGILMELPSAFSYVYQFSQSNGYIYLIAVMVIFILLLLLVIFVEQSYYPISVRYSNVSERKGSPPTSKTSYLPIKINMAGVMPPIFASSLLSLPFTVMGLYAELEGMVLEYFSPGSFLYMLVYAALIVFFSFFYVNMIFNPCDISQMLKRNGGVINAIRPGKHTSDYIKSVIKSVNVLGAFYLTSICIVPEFLRIIYGIPFALGGTSILIMVSVAVDIFSRVQAHIFSHKYKKLLKRGVLFD